MRHRHGGCGVELARRLLGGARFKGPLHSLQAVVGGQGIASQGLHKTAPAAHEPAEASSNSRLAKTGRPSSAVRTKNSQLSEVRKAQQESNAPGKLTRPASSELDTRPPGSPDRGTPASPPQPDRSSLKAFSKLLSVGMRSFRNVAVEVREEAARRLAEQRLIEQSQLKGRKLVLVFDAAQRRWGHTKERREFLLRNRTASSCPAESIAPQRVGHRTNFSAQGRRAQSGSS